MRWSQAFGCSFFGDFTALPSLLVLQYMSYWQIRINWFFHWQENFIQSCLMCCQSWGNTSAGNLYLMTKQASVTQEELAIYSVNWVSLAQPSTRLAGLTISRSANDHHHWSGRETNLAFFVWRSYKGMLSQVHSNNKFTGEICLLMAFCLSSSFNSCLYLWDTTFCLFAFDFHVFVPIMASLWNCSSLHDVK